VAVKEGPHGHLLPGFWGTKHGNTSPKPIPSRHVNRFHDLGLD
jgi:hypothetical protein